MIATGRPRDAKHGANEVGPTARRRVPPAVLGGIVLAWALALVVQLSGHGAQLHHDRLIGGRLPLWVGLVVFLVAWQAHLAAMMLPSSVPMIVLFERASVDQPSRGRVLGAFIGGYAAVWTVFGAAAFAADAMLHELVHSWGWLGGRPWLIGGTTLVVAGVFQFSDAKDRCLRQCRHPGAFLLRHYERGVGGAFRMGKRHGLFCLGCCWALMLLMFAVGVTNLLWMAPLAVVMYLEKTSARGAEITRVVGVGLIVLGAAVLAHPSWAPAALAG